MDKLTKLAIEMVNNKTKENNKVKLNVSAIDVKSAGRPSNRKTPTLDEILTGKREIVIKKVASQSASLKKGNLQDYFMEKVAENIYDTPEFKEERAV